MGGAGDIVTVLSLEDYQYKTGLREAASETRKFATDVTKAGQQANAGMGRSFTQVGFMIQDFSSVLGMGGKNALARAFGSVMNNVQMLGAAFGPWGMAVSAVAGGLGSILIPELLKSSNASEQFALSLKASGEAMDRLISKDKAGLQFGKHLEELGRHGGSKDLEKAIEGNQFEMNSTDMELKARRKWVKDAMQGAASQGGLQYDPLRPLFGKNNELLQPNAALRPDVIGQDTADQIIAEGKKVRDLQDTAGRLKNRQNALLDMRPQARKNDIAAADRELFDKDSAAIEQSRRKARPLWALGNDLQDIKDIGQRRPEAKQFLGPAIDEAFAKYVQSLPKEAKLTAGSAVFSNSSEAWQAIQRHRENDPATNERKLQIEQAKQMVDATKKSAGILESIDRKIGQDQAVALSGGG